MPTKGFLTKLSLDAEKMTVHIKILTEKQTILLHNENNVLLQRIVLETYSCMFLRFNVFSFKKQYKETLDWSFLTS